ncbi:MAG: dihydrodipicolinate synthase family protein [Chloroflexi bacterium]|nr:dihydrodipicolinate synthase family protein [Chloroflexota bacterium]MCL5107968.1 dihydrodipicolinate synthase family protein [Chloroflexota bacterium]
MRFDGIYPPIPTPFNDEGALALDKMAANLACWNRSGIAGYVALGSNGEFVFLNENEKLEIIATVREHAAKEKFVFAGTGCEGTIETIRLTKKAAELGADAAVIITPCYYRGSMNAAALTYHYESIAEASPIPVFLYNMPANTGVDMSADVVVRLAQHPNIVGIKDSSGNVTKLGDIIRQVDPSFHVIAGSASFLYPALCLGAVGGVLALANVAPDRCVELFELARAGRHAAAAELQRRLIPANQAVTAGFGIAGLKAALEMVGLYGGPARGPLRPLGEAQVVQLRQILQTAGIL